MTKKRLIATVGTLACLVFVGLFLLAMFPFAGVTTANFDRIEEGMTRDEVERLLGNPSASRWPKRKIYYMPQLPKLPPGCAETEWGGYEGIVVIHFDDKGTVIQKIMFGSPEPFRDKIHRWLHPSEN
jgi:SmpA / OmlA family